MKKTAIAVLLGLIVAFSASLFAREPLTFEERIKAQEAIERVYYNHRIWPKENPQPKPPFEKMVTKEQIEAKVTDNLKKAIALNRGTVETRYPGDWEPFTRKEVDESVTAAGNVRKWARARLNVEKEVVK